MEEKRILAVLPAGKYFDLLHAAVLAPWAQSRGARLDLLGLGQGSVGSFAPDIENSDLILADVSGRNAAVLYVAGYAQGIGKRVVFLSQFEDDFPFERGQQQVIVYSGNPEFLRKQLDELGRSAEGGAAGNRASPRDRFLEVFGEIMRKHGHEHRGGYEMEGASTFILRDQDLDLALVQELSRRARELGMRIKLM